MKEYCIDFGTWIFTAVSEDEARKKAEKALANGERPIIDTVEEL